LFAHELNRCTLGHKNDIGPDRIRAMVWLRDYGLSEVFSLPRAAAPHAGIIAIAEADFAQGLLKAKSGNS